MSDFTHSKHVENMIHQLKLVQPYFDDVAAGIKKFEVRVNDRDFKVGDILLLNEYDPEITFPSGRQLAALVSYTLEHPDYVKPGMIIMGIELLDRGDTHDR